MKESKNGFTLVELMTVIIILVLLSLAAFAIYNKQLEKNLGKSLVKNALTFEKAALAKLAEDRLKNQMSDNIFHDVMYGKVCYSIKDDLNGKYTSKVDGDIFGSVEVCYGLDCTYETKVWLSDGTYYIDGVSNPKDESIIKSDFDSDYPETCDVKAIGGGTSGNLNVAEYDYSGKETHFRVIIPGVYRLEAWGAQGGFLGDLEGGYGGYSSGEILLKKGDIIYINVGGFGNDKCTNNDSSCVGSYNGGNRGNIYTAGGGGATSLNLVSGLLRNIQPYDVIMVAAGGGGAATTGHSTLAKNAGGKCVYNSQYTDRGNCQSGTFGGFDPVTGTAFGSGGGYYSSNSGRSFNASDSFGIGGVGYTFSSQLKDGIMYCYNCYQTQRVYKSNYTCDTRLIDENATTGKVKELNGFVRITFLEDGFTNTQSNIADRLISEYNTANGTSITQADVYANESSYTDLIKNIDKEICNQ